MTIEKPLSPCVRVCKLVNEICIGCGRTKTEITNWSKLNDKERLDIMNHIKETFDPHDDCTYWIGKL